jgi:hypothetical protein
VSLKSEIKMSVLHDHGVRVDDQLEAAHRRQAGHDGAKQALRMIAKNIAGLAGSVDNDLRDGKLPLDEPAKVASYMKLMVERAANMAMSAAQHQENLQLAAGGEISAYKAMVDSLKKELDLERSKMAALKEAIATGRVVVEDDSASQSDVGSSRDRAIGVRPGSSIAAQRKAEEAVGEEGSSEDVVTDTSDGESSDDGSDKKKKGKRKGS